MGSCYQNCLKVAQAYSFRSIAFPCLGCGFYGFPLDLSIKLVLSTLSHFVETEASALETVILSLGKDREQEAYCAGIDAFVASRI
jgi:O-acetyl-ADP-ribose deacetylase (regulator of RNase III)